MFKAWKKEEKTLQEDPDIVNEAKALTSSSKDDSSDSSAQVSQQAISRPPEYRFVPLTMNGGSFQTSRGSAELLQEIGGGESIRRMTDIFYKKMFMDPHLDTFVLSHEDPHFMRLGNWVVEKMGGEGDVWTKERRLRSKCPVAVRLPEIGSHVVHDRTSAHVAAWFSPKRDPDVIGDHFQLHDARVWMRLHFWAAREAGLLANPSFASWYVRFIAHFVKVYERTAPPFARESARWSENEENTHEYIARGRSMGPEVMGTDGRGVPFSVAIRSLPPHEARDRIWPYNDSEE